MFLAAREMGLDKNEVFWKWYTDFTSHYIGIYEANSPKYTKECADWSADSKNVQKYLDDGHIMKDLLMMNKTNL